MKSKKTKLSEQDILSYLNRLNSPVHVNTDQILHISDLELKILAATPKDGRITRSTVNFKFLNFFKFTM